MSIFHEASDIILPDFGSRKDSMTLTVMTPSMVTLSMVTLSISRRLVSVKLSGSHSGHECIKIGATMGQRMRRIVVSIQPNIRLGRYGASRKQHSIDPFNLWTQIAHLAINKVNHSAKASGFFAA